MEQGGIFTGFKLERLRDFGPWVGLSFLILAITAAAFIRLRQRWLKILALVTSGLLTSTMVILSSSKLDLFAFIGLVLLMLSFLLVPALLDRRIRHSNQQTAN